MQGYQFTRYFEKEDQKSPFEKLLDLFMELMVYTAGDVDEALDWMQELDDTYGLTDEEYTMDDFIADLHAIGYIRDGDGSGNGGGLSLTAKSEQNIRKRALDQIFGKMKKGSSGQHRTRQAGLGDEPTTDRRQYSYGDRLEQIAFTDSIRNAQINHGLDGGLQLTEDDLEVVETEYKTQTSTVLMIDLSHSMILYGEDRITPAKKVAMALAELIKTRYPKDTLDIVVFGNDAWQISVKDLPYLQVGPYHTNTVAGLELALDLLRRRKNNNKQIFMITDGKPSCLKVDGGYYKNSWGLDPKITNKCLNLAAQCRKLRIPITTFMIANDPYLQAFVEEFTEANKGKAFYTGLQGLGDIVFADYAKNKRRRM